MIGRPAGSESTLLILQTLTLSTVDYLNGSMAFIVGGVSLHLALKFTFAIRRSLRSLL